MTIEDLNPHAWPLNLLQIKNLTQLLKVVNAAQAAYGQTLICNSGFRNLREQARIDEAAGRKVLLGSAHCKGAAVDLADPKGELKKWIMKNLSLFEANNCYFEDFKYTPTWVHIQIYPPKSLKRFFIPYA